jgi:hypothetical protein
MKPVIRSFLLILILVIISACDQPSEQSNSQPAGEPPPLPSVGQVEKAPMDQASRPLSDAKVSYNSPIEKLRMAAKSGNPDAQFELGLHYFEGKGVTKDLVEAYIWFRIAATKGHAASKSAAMDLQKVLNSYGILKEANIKGNIYYTHYIQNKKTTTPPDPFVFTVNGTRYQFIAAIKPEFPIIIKGAHQNSDVKAIKMQRVDDPLKAVSFPADLTQNIKNTQKKLENGESHFLEFVALNKKGERQGSVMILFIPE